MKKKYFTSSMAYWAEFAIKNDLRKMSKVERELYNKELEKLHDKIMNLCYDFRSRWTYGRE